MLSTDKHFPNTFAPLLVNSVDLELWVEGLTAIHSGEDLGNIGGELGTEGTNRESMVSSKQLLWGGKSQGLCHWGRREALQNMPWRVSSRGRKTWLLLIHS